MKRLNGYQKFGIIIILFALIFLIWATCGGIELINEINDKQIEKIIENF